VLETVLALLKEKRKKLASVYKRAAVLDKEILELVKQQQSMCQHENITDQSSYSPGTYYDTDYTLCWRKCSDCGLESERLTKNHGNYG